MVLARIAFAAAWLLAGAVAVAADAPGRRVDELMRKSGLWEQVGQIQAQVKQGAADRAKFHVPGAPGLSDEQFERLSIAMQQAYAPDRMRTIVRKVIAETLSAEDESSVLEWLSSDLGARITRLEEKAGEPEELARAEREAPRLVERVPAPRMEKFTHLAESLRMGDSGAQLMINIAVAVAYGAAYSMPNGDEGGAVKLRDQLEEQRPQMAAMLSKLAIDAFAYTYRSLTDEEVDRYVAFASAPAGLRYHEATMAALNQAFAQGSLEVGRSLGRTLTNQDRRS